MTAEEIKKLLAVMHCSGDPLAWRDEALFATYTLTGIRRAEALALRIKDYNRNELLLSLISTKGGQPAVRVVPAQLARLLNQYLSGEPWAESSDPNAPMFSGRYRHAPLSTKQAQARLERWKKIAGIRRPVTIHSLRAGFATLLHQETADILLVARALGHDDPKMTQRYVGRDLEALRGKIERSLNEVIEV